MKDYRFVNDLWNEEKASALDPLERLVYRSNILGDDQRITNTGGGNTSSKLDEMDPLTGKEVNVLWVKGSGGDLRTSKKENFASLYMEKFSDLEAIYNAAPDRGVKTEIEDRMVAMYPHCTFNLNPRASSIDTPLHAYIPHRHVDHTHPNAVISIAAARNSRELTEKVYGSDLVWTPWQRPGYDLGLKLGEICRQNPDAKGVLLGQHGLINWADDDKECYYLSLDLIEKAAAFIEENDKGEQTFGGARYKSLPEEQRMECLANVLPWLRGRVSREKRFIGTIQSDDAILRFINSVDAPRLAALGTSCPDHFLRTKIRPLYVDWDPEGADLDALRGKLSDALDRYREEYKAYYDRCKRPDSPAMRDPNPTVILIPGLGMVAWGKNKSESRVTAEFYNCAVEVIRGAEAIDEYVALPEQEAFDIEYWALEEAKLRRMPPEKELARQVVAVVGAGSGIGREVAHRVAPEGAEVVCIDLQLEAARETARQVTERMGQGIGVAGTGISNCGPAVGLAGDVTSRESVRRTLQQAVLAYGGLDAAVVTAGIICPPDTSGKVPEDKWALTYSVNVTGAYLVADEAGKILREQGLPGNVILTTSVNAVVPKNSNFAYDTSKAAANHLVREMAIELAPNVRVNGVAPATVIQGSGLFPRDRVLTSLAKYGVPFSEDEETDALVAKLARFYADRSLTKQPIVPADQAEAVFLLLSSRLSKTTGQILTVDGGLTDAFLR